MTRLGIRFQKGAAIAGLLRHAVMAVSAVVVGLMAAAVYAAVVKVDVVLIADVAADKLYLVALRVTIVVVYMAVNIGYIGGVYSRVGKCCLLGGFVAYVG